MTDPPNDRPWLVIEGGTLDVGVWYSLSPWWHPWRRREERRRARREVLRLTGKYGR